MMKIKNKKGFSLIESMIAVTVFSFGLLGVAGVMTVAVKNNHNGYMRSQAAFLASSIVDAMRRNREGVWQGNYNGTFSGYSAVSSLCTTAGCFSPGIAARDVQKWSNMIDQRLPNSSGTIACVSPGPPIHAFPNMIQIPSPSNPGVLISIPCTHCTVEPYNGFCDITINWSESNVSVNLQQVYTLPGKP